MIQNSTPQAKLICYAGLYVGGQSNSEVLTRQNLFGAGRQTRDVREFCFPGPSNVGLSSIHALCRHNYISLLNSHVPQVQLADLLVYCHHSNTRLIQNISDYKSTVPSVLLPLINQLSLFDRHRLFAFDSLHVPIDNLVKSLPVNTPAKLVRFLGSTDQAAILEDSPQSLNDLIKTNEAVVGQQDLLTVQRYKTLTLEPNQFLLSQLGEDKIKEIASTTCTSLDELKLRVQANYYVRISDFRADFQSMVRWNQIFRAHGALSFIWITAIIDQANRTILSDPSGQKFRLKKIDDVSRLMKYETIYKIQTSNYPWVPTSFREYSYIKQYIPTPIERTQEIWHKMASKKQPIQCPEDCSCLSETSSPFCNFSLVDGTWQSSCKNRQNRIECNHSDPDVMKRCRNAEIRLGQRKSCKTNSNQEGEFDIEECLIWGIDYYTRKNITHSLPQFDVVDLELRDNSVEKSDFVNNLIKATNYNGTQGYDMVKACYFIVENSPKLWVSPTTSWSYHQDDKSASSMFSYKDKMYAQHLTKVLSLNVDQTGFRIHSKGKGARCLNKKGINQSQFIVEYFGQVYEPWRWYQRQDHTKRIMKQQKLSNLPDFYNIYLEKHNDQQDGYEMLVVDPISHGNFASRFSHSCYPNCGTIITVSNGRYYIGMYALRDIQIGEELTFDYCSITQSTQEHNQAICLCGTKICRGNYLQLGNAKQQNYILDQHFCFLSRNSALLHSSIQAFSQGDIQLLGKYNVKGNMLDGCSEWLKKWAFYIMKFIQFECVEYKKEELKKLETIKYKEIDVITDEEIRQRSELIAQIKKGDLFNARFQNLITSLDKLKVYLGSIKDEVPPIFRQDPQIVLSALWDTTKLLGKHPPKEGESVILSLVHHFRKHNLNRELSLIQEISKYIKQEPLVAKKLYFARLGFLMLSHLLRTNTNRNDQIADILYFYAFTHTFFTTHDYRAFDSQKMVVHFKDFLTAPSKLQNQQDVCKKQYSSQFVWGQLVAWFKQTIASPQSSLSQDRRGTLSYPTIQSITRVCSYPFQSHTRQRFFEVLVEKPYSSWPPEGCPWSYKNVSKSYGTFLFESFFNSEKLRSLQLVGMEQQGQLNPAKKLIRCVRWTIDKSIDTQFNLFAQVQGLLEGISAEEILQHKGIFWGQDFEESKRSSPIIGVEEPGRLIMKKVKSE